MVKIRGIEFEANLDNAMGLEVLQPVPPLGLPVPELAVFPGRQDRAHPLHGEVGRAVAAHHHLDALDHPHRRAGACRAGHALHRRGAAAAFLRLRHRRLDPEEEVGVDHRRRSRDRPAARRSARATSLIINTGWHKLYEDGDYFCLLPRLRSVGRRVDDREEGQGRRSRHAGQRPSARHRHRPAAQRPAAPASRRRVQRVVGRPRLEGRLPGLGAGPPHDLQGRHPRHRECRRRPRRGHRASAAPSPSSRGTGTAATAASSASSPSSIPSRQYRIEKGEAF